MHHYCRTQYQARLGTLPQCSRPISSLQPTAQLYLSAKSAQDSKTANYTAMVQQRCLQASSRQLLALMTGAGAMRCCILSRSKLLVKVAPAYL